MIHLDYNATTPVLPEVMQAMLPYFSDFWGNASSTHCLGRKGREAIEKARGHVASLIGAAPEEIVFTSGATESIQAVLHSFLRGGLPVVSSTVEHQAALSVLDYREEPNQVTLIGVNGDGQLDCEKLRAEL